MTDRILSGVVNTLREARDEQGWSQQALAVRSGVSRAEISAIETGRLVPSTAVALALGGALERSVEELFRLERDEERTESWAWDPGPVRRWWRAEVGGEVLLYPAETTARGFLPQDGPLSGADRGPAHGTGRGTARGAGRGGRGEDPRTTLVLAGCDPAAGMLGELLRPAAIRLLPFVRSSGQALDLLRAGRVHAAGLHLGDTVEANEREVQDRLGAGFRLLPLARWREGVAVRPGTGLDTVAGVLRARLRWVGREPGSGARRCLDELLDGGEPPEGYDHLARDHRGVVETIRTGWAQAGVCVELAAEEGGLDFLPVRTEAYDLCFPVELEGDPRIRALTDVVRSRRFRALVNALPGYRAA